MRHPGHKKFGRFALLLEAYSSSIGVSANTYDERAASLGQRPQGQLKLKNRRRSMRSIPIVQNYPSESDDVHGMMFIRFRLPHDLPEVVRIRAAFGAEHDDCSFCVIQWSMIINGATIFLWAVLAQLQRAAWLVGDDKHRAVINTYLSLAACHSECHPAGGVAVGTVSDMMIKPYGAVIIGSFGRRVSGVGYAFLAKRLRANNFLDTCGVNNLHGMPGILAAVFGILYSGLASFDEYGYGSFRPGAPKMANGSFVLRLPFLDNVPTADFFLDNPVWNVPEDYDGKQHRPKRREGSRASGDAGAASALIATGDGKQRDEAEEGRAILLAIPIQAFFLQEQAANPPGQYREEKRRKLDICSAAAPPTLMLFGGRRESTSSDADSFVPLRGRRNYKPGATTGS
uniref:Ammonium_transp domain-containing protein n=1 Tax=Macrostomum lignano TaxID=282301 RepID=A0A1I8F6I5_9PLAT